MAEAYDVAIIGGGPAGSTTGSLLRKYNPDLRVLILEKARFPREHVGESQLPAIGSVLNEMGCWDKVEAANFPIKIGASYTWGQTTEPWEFEFLPLSQVPGEISRPCPFAGWRTQTALQVDRARYDQILLDHAASLGCEVRQGALVRSVQHADGHVSGLTLDSGESITARHYCDASGNAAVLRRALGIEVEVPTSLQNVAFWDYWEGRIRGDDMISHGVTRVRIRSLPYGWIWFIPLSETRTSVGVVMPAAHYKSLKKRPAEVYEHALREEPSIWASLSDAASRGRVESTTDWSFVAKHAVGDNWFLVGEAAGFADPILAAGLTLTHWAARHCAYAILELDRGEHDAEWIKSEYEAAQLKRLRQHIRFADYWYSANGCFTDLQDFCSNIAKESGLKLSPQEAFRWLSNGGLDDIPGGVGIGGLTLGGIKSVQTRLAPHGKAVAYTINGKSTFKLNTRGATEVDIPVLRHGRIQRAKALKRGQSMLQIIGASGLMYDALRQASEITEIIAIIRRRVIAGGAPAHAVERLIKESLYCLELMANNYWVTCSTRRGAPTVELDASPEGEFLYSTRLGPRGNKPATEVAR